MDKLLNLIGLAKKAGKLEVGEEPVGAAARSKHARLILIASDAADNTRRRARHFGDVDRLCGGIRLITRVWRVCRPLFLRFHHIPLVLGFPRTASFRPSHTATSWPQVPSS